MRARHFWSHAWRESRGAHGRLLFFGSCLALGVAAVTGVSALVGAIEAGLLAQSRELMGADLSVDSRFPLPAELDRCLDLPGAERADTRELATVVLAQGQSRLVDLKAVSPAFPFYGRVDLEPAGELGALLGTDRCAVASELAAELGLSIGDSLSIGGAAFQVAAFVRAEPGRLDVSLTLGPRVFVGLEGLDRTGLEELGSRVRYRALYKTPVDLSAGALRDLRERLDRELPQAAYLRMESHRQSQRTLRRALDRTERYLGLVALLSLVLGGAGIAQIVRSWIASRKQSVAILRAIGFRPREVLLVYLGHVVLLALCSSLLGALAGAAVPLVFARLVPQLLPAGVQLSWDPWSAVRGIALGVAMAAIFSAVPLTAIWRISPLRALRGEVEPLRAPVWLPLSAASILAGGLFVTAWRQSESAAHAAVFCGGLALLVSALGLAARAAALLARRIPRERWNPYLRNGIAALGRPEQGVPGAIVALGLGVLVASSMGWIQSRLEQRLAGALPADAPSLFLLDIQPDQWPGVEALLGQRGAEHVQGVPVLTARLESVGGTSVRELTEGRQRGRWQLTREQRITWLDQLAPDNRIVDGRLWSDPERFELSVERGFAEELGVKPGSALAFDVQGVPVELQVTSIRTVEWESFGINFFLVAEPGAFQDAPHFVLAAARLPVQAELAFQDDLARTFPNVTPIRIRPILEKILEVTGRVAFGVRLLGYFTVAVALAIMAGIASASSVHRGREVALWKVLGLTRAGVARLLGIEYALLGLLAGSIGALGGAVLAWGFLEQLLEIPARIPWWSLPAVALTTAALAAGMGLAANARAFAVRPVEVYGSKPVSWRSWRTAPKR
jgi:putative ABC transport system permease protein